MTYDLLLKGGRVIDPAQGLDAVRDIAFSGGKVARVAESSPGGELAMSEVVSMSLPAMGGARCARKLVAPVGFRRLSFLGGQQAEGLLLHLTLRSAVGATGCPATQSRASRRANPLQRSVRWACGLEGEPLAQPGPGPSCARAPPRGQEEAGPTGLCRARVSMGCRELERPGRRGFFQSGVESVWRA